MCITHVSVDRSNSVGYSLIKLLGAALGAEVGTERSSTDGCLGGNGYGNPEDSVMGGYILIRLILWMLRC